MEVFQTTKQVVNDGSDVLILQKDGRFDDLLQVTLRKAEHNINSVEIFKVTRLDDVVKLYYKSMV